MEGSVDNSEDKESGIPKLRDSTIEKKALQLIEKYSPDFLTIPRELTVLDLLDYLKNNYRLKFSLEDLGHKNGQKILGQTLIRENTILLTKDYFDLPKHIQLTIAAHEIGHWKLHRGEKIRIPSDSKESECSPLEVLIDYADEGTYIDVVGPKKKLKTPIDWVEHQAKVFASTLLMPPKAFLRALESAQGKLELPHRDHKIYLNKEAYSHRDMMKTFEIMQGFFGVSITAIRIRAEKMGLIVDQRGVRPNTGGRLSSINAD